MKINVPRLIICLLIPLAVGGVSAFATQSSVDYWYTLLHKSSFNPPNYIFAPVWTVLYVLLGITLYRLWSAPASNARTAALVFFALQMALNFVWSFLFFYFRLIGPALVEIIALWFSIVALAAFAFRSDRPSSLLQIPYIVWVAYATGLNWSIYLLN